MTPTIYTTGDAWTLFQALNAVSMVFNGDFWGASGHSGTIFGGGAALALGLMLTFGVGVLSAMMQQQSIRYEPLLFSLILYVGLFVPTIDVQVESLRDGSVARVDNVPLGIGLTGSAISGMTKSIADGIDTVFQSVGAYDDAPAAATTEGGFLRPLYVFSALRTMESKVLDQEKSLFADIQAFAYNCVAGRNEYNAKQMNESPDPIAYLMDSGLFDRGMSYHIDDAHPNARAIICREQATQLRNDIQNFYYQPRSFGTSTQTGAGVLFNKSMHAISPDSVLAQGGQTGYVMPWQTESIDAAVQSLTGSEMIDSYSFMNKVLFGNRLRTYLRCSNHGSIRDYQTCITNNADSTMLVSNERSAAEEAASADKFMRLMPSAMSAFEFLFYALSPIIAVVIALTGMKSAKVLMSFLMFGIWSQSWMPIAKIIHFLILTQTREAIVQLSLFGNGISLDTIYDMFDVIQTKLMIGNTLLAATPVVTLGLLTGSTFAMTGVANRLSQVGGDKFDEARIAPAFGSAAPQVAVGSLRGPTPDANVMSGMQAGGGWQPRSAELTSMAPTQNFGQSISSAASASHTMAQHAQERASSAVSDAVEKGGRSMQSGGWKSNTSTGQQHQVGAALDTYRQIAKETGNIRELSDSEALKGAARMVLDAGGKLGGNSDSGLGGSLGGKGSLSTDDSTSNQKAHRDTHGISEGVGQNKRVSTSDMDTMQTGLEAFYGSSNELHDSWSHAQRSSDEWSRTSQYADQLSRTAQHAQSMGMNQSVNLSQFGDRLRAQNLLGITQGTIDNHSQRLSGAAGEQYGALQAQREKAYGGMGFDPQMSRFMGSLDALNSLPGSLHGGDQVAAMAVTGDIMDRVFSHAMGSGAASMMQQTANAVQGAAGLPDRVNAAIGSKSSVAMPGGAGGTGSGGTGFGSGSGWNQSASNDPTGSHPVTGQYPLGGTAPGASPSGFPQQPQEHGQPGAFQGAGGHGQPGVFSDQYKRASNDLLNTPFSKEEQLAVSSAPEGLSRDQYNKANERHQKMADASDALGWAKDVQAHRADGHGPMRAANDATGQLIVDETVGAVKMAIELDTALGQMIVDGTVDAAKGALRLNNALGQMIVDGTVDAAKGAAGAVKSAYENVAHAADGGTEGPVRHAIQKDQPGPEEHGQPQSDRQPQEHGQPGAFRGPEEHRQPQEPQQPQGQGQPGAFRGPEEHGQTQDDRQPQSDRQPQGHGQPGAFRGPEEHGQPQGHGQPGVFPGGGESGASTAGGGIGSALDELMPASNQPVIVGNPDAELNRYDTGNATGTTSGTPDGSGARSMRTSDGRSQVRGKVMVRGKD